MTDRCPHLVTFGNRVGSNGKIKCGECRKDPRFLKLEGLVAEKEEVEQWLGRHGKHPYPWCPHTLGSPWNLVGFCHYCKKEHN